MFILPQSIKKFKSGQENTDIKTVGLLWVYSPINRDLPCASIPRAGSPLRCDRLSLSGLGYKMNRTKDKWHSLLSIICLLLLVTGCALDASRMHPEFDIRAGSIQESVLITPDVSMYELSSGGRAMLRDDWSGVGRQNLQNAILRDFMSKKRSVKLVQMDTQTAKEIAEVQALYGLVHKTMDQHTFGPHQNMAENDGFIFSLGSLDSLLQKFGADAMIFVTGYDQVYNGGHKALIDLAIADSSGTILYYTVKGTTEGRDLRDPASTAALIRDLLASFSRLEG